MASPRLIELHERADAGDLEAMAFTAVVAALGVGEPASWPQALRRLARAAELGSSSAEQQLAVLSSDGLLGAPEAAVRQPLSQDPSIASLPGFVPPAACQWLMSRAAGRLRRSEIFDPTTGERRVHPVRNNSVLGFSFRDFDLVMVAVRMRIAAAVGVPHGRLEPSQVMHYAPGEAFRPHHDFLDPQLPGFAAELEARGQRVTTFLIYLNAEFEGGETDFPAAGVRYKGQAGDGLTFANLDATGAPHLRTLHAGLPVISGEKWLFSQWIRDRTAI